MPNNLYYPQEQQAGLLGTIGSLALPIGVFVGHGMTTKHLVPGGRRGQRLLGHKRSILGNMFRTSPADRYADIQARKAVDAFFEGRGWNLSGRFERVRRALSIATDPSIDVETTIHLKRGRVTKHTYLRQFGRRGHFNTYIHKESPFYGKGIGVHKNIVPAKGLVGKVTTAVSRAPVGRTVAALARPILGIGVAWYTVGTTMTMIADGLVAGFNSIARLGEQINRERPETATGLREMATRERAFTMRQAAAMAIHMSQTGTRAALGQEASFLH